MKKRNYTLLSTGVFLPAMQNSFAVCCLSLTVGVIQCGATTGYNEVAAKILFESELKTGLPHDLLLTDSTSRKNVRSSIEKDTITEFGAYTKFSFVPGNQILFYDDFSQEELGDFPTQWETAGTGEVVRIPSPGLNWFSLMRRSGYLPVTKEPLPKNYTIEFDLMSGGFEQGQSGFFRLLFMPKKVLHGSRLGSKLAAVKFYLNHHAASTKPKDIDVTNGNSSADIRNSLSYDYSKIAREKVHFSIAVSDKRLQVWLDEEKVVDVPSLLKEDYGRYFLIEAHDVLKENGEYLFISNFKIAAAPEKQRSLFSNNRFSTTGIYFNTNSAVVRQESYGLLKMIAEAMQSDNSSTFHITGHTDADGSEAFNQALSERRALAVKQILSSQFGIADSRITTSGKGESEPVDDNNTQRGKANNRRVEIVKK